MSIGNIGSYNTNKQVSFPDHHIDPNEKDHKWHRQWCEAMYGAWIRDQGGVPYSRREEFELLRLYADGNQPTQKYMDWLDPIDQATNARKGLMNISWDIMSVAPKILEVVVGMFMKLDHGITITAIDEKSGADKEQIKHRIWAEKKLRPFLESVNPALAQGGVSEILPFLPDSMEEIKMYQEIGAFKLEDEIAMEKAIDYSLDISDWKDIKRKIYEDLFTIGIASNKDYVEPATQLVKTRYVDPKNLIASYSRDHNFKNLAYAGELTYYTIAELRKAAPDLSEEEIVDIVKRYANHQGKDQRHEIEYSNGGDVNGGYYYDNFKVAVLDAEWFDYDTKNYTERIKDTGRFIYEEEFDPKLPEATEKRKPKYSRLQTVRKAKWVVGSPYLFDWGYQNDIPRPSKSKAKLSYHIYKANNKSKVSSMIPHLDNLQLAILKLRNAIAKAAPAGLSVEYGSLNNMSLGGKKMLPLDILTIRRHTGDLLFKATTHYTQVVSPNSGKPVTETTGGVGPYLEELLKTIQVEIQFIRDITGINEFVDASSPDPNQPVATGKMAVGSANNVLHAMYIGYQRLHEEVAENICLRWQVVSRYASSARVHFPALGSNTMEVLKIGSDMSSRQFGLKIDEKPTAEDITDVKQAAIASMRKGEAGGSGITMADFMFITRILKSGHPKQAEIVLAYREKKAFEQQQQIQKENMQLNDQNAANQEQRKLESLKIETQLKTESAIAIDTAKSNNRMNEENNRHRNKIDLARKHGDNDTDKETVRGQNDRAKQSKEHNHQKELAEKSTAA